jgi:hypothetical protein
LTEKASSEVTRLILPFSVLSENRKEPFTKDMEKAAIFSFAELERAKGGGLILKRPAEKLAFITESFYPFWLILWGRLELLFDGRNITAHTSTYRTVPDAKTFMQSVERSSKTLETFTTILSDNVNYFQAPTNANEIVINGLVTDTNFLNEFASYLNHAKQPETPPPGVVMLLPTIDESAISSQIQELEKLKSEFKEDVSTLYAGMKLLNRTTRNFVKTIRGKIKTIKEEFGKEIKEEESAIAPKITLTNEEYDGKITKLTRDFEKQLLPLQREKVKHEKTREQTLSRIESYKTEAKTCASKKDVVGERKWKEKASEGKKELSEIEAKIKESEGKIKGVEEGRTLETFNLRSEWEAKIKEARKNLLELEASRDSEIQLHSQEIEKLEKLSSAIIEQIDKTAKSRESSIAGFEKLGIQQKHEETALIYMPFYIVCYRSEAKRRYSVFPPSTANSVSLLTKLKGALGRTKVRQFLAPQFKAITSHLNSLPALIERNAVFEREINEAGDKADILRTNSAREQIKNGLKQLKEEGWLSEKEYEAFNQKLA